MKPTLRIHTHWQVAQSPCSIPPPRYRHQAGGKSKLINIENATLSFVVAEIKKAEQIARLSC